MLQSILPYLAWFFFVSFCFIFLNHRKRSLFLLITTNLLLFYDINYQWSSEPTDKYVVCLKKYGDSRRMRWFPSFLLCGFYKTLIIINLERTSFAPSCKAQPIIKGIQGRKSAQEPASRTSRKNQENMLPKACSICFLFFFFNLNFSFSFILHTPVPPQLIPISTPLKW